MPAAGSLTRQPPAGKSWTTLSGSGRTVSGSKIQVVPPAPTLGEAGRYLFGTVGRVIRWTWAHLQGADAELHLVFVYDEGHSIRTDRPEAFADVVPDFVERYEAFVISRTPTLIHP
jgi:hypothetical protein